MPFLLNLKADVEKLKAEAEVELASKLESKTKGLERVVLENENLRRDIKRVRSSSSSSPNRIALSWQQRTSTTTGCLVGSAVV